MDDGRMKFPLIHGHQHFIKTVEEVAYWLVVIMEYLLKIGGSRRFMQRSS